MNRFTLGDPITPTTAHRMSQVTACSLFDSLELALPVKTLDVRRQWGQVTQQMMHGQQQRPGQNMARYSVARTEHGMAQHSRIQHSAV